MRPTLCASAADLSTPTLAFCASWARKRSVAAAGRGRAAGTHEARGAGRLPRRRVVASTSPPTHPQQRLRGTTTIRFPDDGKPLTVKTIYEWLQSDGSWKPRAVTVDAAPTE